MPTDPFLREPYQSEKDYFQKNKNVAGYADFNNNKVVLNPFSNLSDIEKNAVIKNEKTRLFIRKNNVPLDFSLTPEQENAFVNYGSDLNKKETIIARIVSGDPSAGNFTPEQKEIADKIAGEISTYGLRPDGTPKGSGFLGELIRPDGGISTEVSIGLNFDGKEVLLPLIVPTLSKGELDFILKYGGNGKIPKQIINKAAAHALQRMREGKSPFKMENE